MFSQKCNHFKTLQKLNYLSSTHSRSERTTTLLYSSLEHYLSISQILVFCLKYDPLQRGLGDVVSAINPATYLSACFENIGSILARALVVSCAWQSHPCLLRFWRLFMLQERWCSLAVKRASSIQCSWIQLSYWLNLHPRGYRLKIINSSRLKQYLLNPDSHQTNYYHSLFSERDL